METSYRWPKSAIAEPLTTNGVKCCEAPAQRTPILTRVGHGAALNVSHAACECVSRAESEHYCECDPGGQQGTPLHNAKLVATQQVSLRGSKGYLLFIACQLREVGGLVPL